jgi:replicative DNA helicase
VIAEAQAMRTRARREAPPPITIEGLPAHTNLEAERSVLGAMLADPDHLVDLAQDQGLREDDFFAPAHRVIFGALTKMREASQAIDPSTLLAWLTDRKLSDAAGGPALIGELASGVISVFTAPTHIQQVKDKSLLRELQQACARIVVGAHERPHEVQIILDEAERDILEIRGARETLGITKAAEVAPKTIAMIEQLIRGKGHYGGIPSGFDELDQMTTGFKGGEMIVIAARPGVGKTALALSMARHILRQRFDVEKDDFVRPGYPVAFFSLEMSAQQLMFRLLSSHAGLDSEQIRRGQLSDSQITALRGVAAEIGDLPLLLDESSLLSIGQLRARARRLKKMHNIGIIFVDYLQLLTSGTDRARESRQVEVSEISRGLKALAMELNIPVVVLAQLNRKPEETNQDPALHHLRESGSIEQDADVVLLLNRENNPEDNESTEGRAEEGEADQPRPAQRGIVCKLNIAKQRNGPTDRIRLLFQPRFTRFDSLPREAR